MLSSPAKNKLLLVLLFALTTLNFWIRKEDLSRILAPGSSRNERSNQGPVTDDEIKQMTILPYMYSQIEIENIRQIHALPNPKEGQKFVISYSLYVSNPAKAAFYIQGIIRNCDLARTYFPGWEVWVYHDDSVPKDAIQKLKEKGAKTIRRPDEFDGTGSAGMIWRFLVADDKTVDRFIVRDTDSRLNARERFAVEEWIESGRSTHFTRDHPQHCCYVWMGGMWGGTRGMLGDRKMGDLLLEWMDANNKKDEQSYLDDQNFLQELLNFIPPDQRMFHISYKCGSVTFDHFPFPTKRDDNFQFLGQVFDIDDVPNQAHIEVLKKDPVPEQCRPANHKDWLYG